MKERPAWIERWFFYQGMANLWKWARLDGFGTVLGCSRSEFGSREDSVADAHRNGYREERLVSETTPTNAARMSRWTAGAETRGDNAPGSETPESPA